MTEVKVTNGFGSNVNVNNSSPNGVTVQPQVIKSHSLSATPAAVKVEVANTDKKVESHLSFEKPSAQQVETTNEQPTTTETEVEKPATSAERRDAMKRANAEHAKAIQMQKEAKALMEQARHFDEIKQKAATNPVELAKALGMDPNEFLRRYQNEMFNIPNEEVKKPELTVDEKLKRFEEERAQEKRAQANYQAEMIRMNYISTKILPAIKADAEKYQLLNYNNPEASAGFIYDIMNDHYQKTGEELNAADVAEEMENQLQKEFEEKIESVKKISKFSKHFAKMEEEATKSEKEEVSLTPAQLGGKKEWTGAKSPVPTPSRGSKTKEARLARLKGL